MAEIVETIKSVLRLSHKLESILIRDDARPTTMELRDQVKFFKSVVIASRESSEHDAVEKELLSSQKTLMEIVKWLQQDMPSYPTARQTLISEAVSTLKDKIRSVKLSQELNEHIKTLQTLLRTQTL